MSSQAIDNNVIARLQQNPGSVCFYHLPNSFWPYSHVNNYHNSSVRIAVLDSSFNPPTVAHFALAVSPYPSISSHNSDLGSNKGNYDAHLLLLSVKNADKVIKAGDATYEQRLEMMYLFAQSLQTLASLPNVAVAIIDEPIFVCKSALLTQVISDRIRELSPSKVSPDSTISEFDLHVFPPMLDPSIELTFLVGFDTLERLFSPRYYPSASEDAMYAALHKMLDPLSEGGEGAKVACAYRASITDLIDEGPIYEPLQAAEIFVRSGRVSYIHLSAKEAKLSSTHVRRSRLLGDDIWRTMVPPLIAHYIFEKGLYLESL